MVRKEICSGSCLLLKCNSIEIIPDNSNLVVFYPYLYIFVLCSLLFFKRNSIFLYINNIYGYKIHKKNYIQERQCFFTG